jgi:hypothetical protein
MSKEVVVIRPTYEYRYGSDVVRRVYTADLSTALGTVTVGEYLKEQGFGEVASVVAEHHFNSQIVPIIAVIAGMGANPQHVGVDFVSESEGVRGGLVSIAKAVTALQEGSDFLATCAAINPSAGAIKYEATVFTVDDSDQAQVVGLSKKLPGRQLLQEVLRVASPGVVQYRGDKPLGIIRGEIV